MAGEIDGEIHSKMVKRYWFKKTYMEVNPILQRKVRVRWLREREISMTMMSMYIIILMGRAPARSRGWNGGWVWAVGR